MRVLSESAAPTSEPRMAPDGRQLAPSPYPANLATALGGGVPVRNRDWFIVGMVAGFVYSFMKWPAGCGCMLLLVAGFMALLIAAYWDFAWPIALAVAAVVGGVKLFRAWQRSTQVS
jgi:integral membrane sensor domain MASE1